MKTINDFIKILEDNNTSNVVSFAAQTLYVDLSERSSLDEIPKLYEYLINNYGENEITKWSENELNQHIKDWCIEKCNNVYNNILLPLIKNNKIKIWRVISASKDWNPNQSQKLGIFWSWNEFSAETYWGNHEDNKIDWLLCGEVNASDINWVDTILMNSDPDFEDEHEIRLKYDSKIFFLWYQKRNKPKTRVMINKLTENNND